jgi:prolipoprotein diacylglyceryltransferase
VLAGKSIVGALLGGLLAVEGAKVALGVRVATGDLYVRPLWIGLAVGRVGCFLSGVTDGTHGLPVAWGMDLGDGVPRHPTALYEVSFLVLYGLLLERVRWERAGDKFAAFLIGYLWFRVGVEALKPVPRPWWGLSGIQVASLAGAGAFSAWVRVRGRRGSG